MRTAAFDLSSNSGVAVWDGQTPAPLLLKKRVLYWDRDEGVMLEHWRSWLVRFFDQHRPEVVAIEGAVVGGHTDSPTILRQAQIRGMLLWCCYHLEIPVHAIAPSSWRKTFIGFGARGKRQNVDWKALAKARCRALGWDYLGSHDVAEAAGVLTHLLVVTLGLSPPWAVLDELLLPLPELGQ